MFDLLIKGGFVLDGTGRDGFSADVAITDGVIAEVGKITGPAHREIDADGLCVTPGFVDIHSHFDGQVSWDSVLEPSSGNGVTSTVMGNCGVGFAPARRDSHDWLIGLLEAVEDIPGTALSEGLTWNWETFPQYLDALGERQYTMDIGAQIPHIALRTFVMGARGANHDEHPQSDEIAAMANLVGEALKEGALGFSTSRTVVHRYGDGSVLGTTFAQQDELSAIAKAMREAGTGVIQLISDTFQSDDADYIEREINLIRQLASESGRPLSFTVTQGNDNPEAWREMLRDVGQMVSEGLAVSAQIAPRGVGGLMSLTSSFNPFRAAPAFETIREMDIEPLIARLREPETRRRILDEWRQQADKVSTPFAKLNFERIYRMAFPVDYEPTAETSAAALSSKAGQAPIEYLYDAFLEEGGSAIFFSPQVNYTYGNLDPVYEMMADPNVLYGVSDAGAHCGVICDATFPTTSLALWSRGNRGGKRLSPEFLVHRYTQRNARHVGWYDRGVIAPGYLADVNVINLEALDLEPPRMIRDLPAGGRRFIQKAHGYDYTVKSGQVTFEHGNCTGALPGRLVRGERNMA